MFPQLDISTFVYRIKKTMCEVFNRTLYKDTEVWIIECEHSCSIEGLDWIEWEHSCCKEGLDWNQQSSSTWDLVIVGGNSTKTEPLSRF